jgi:hypothetical protein
MGVHVAAILGLGALCALWVVLQRANRRPGSHCEDGGSGRCGACAARRDGEVGAAYTSRATSPGEGDGSCATTDGSAWDASAGRT